MRVETERDRVRVEMSGNREGYSPLWIEYSVGFGGNSNLDLVVG